jgi:hypothetical protein
VLVLGQACPHGHGHGHQDGHHDGHGGHRTADPGRAADPGSEHRSLPLREHGHERGGSTSTYVQAVSDPQGCPDQLLVQLLAGNTGGAWNTEPAGGSVPGTVVCDLTASNTGEVVVSTDDKYAITAKAAGGGLEQAGMVPD